MGEVRPQVIQDLIKLATYIGEDNLEVSDRFLFAAEETFKQLGKMPSMGKLCQFSHPNLSDVQQQPIKGFKKYLIFYQEIDSVVEILQSNVGILKMRFFWVTAALLTPLSVSLLCECIRRISLSNLQGCFILYRNSWKSYIFV
jgi:toxin ParE1/3/4